LRDVAANRLPPSQCTFYPKFLLDAPVDPVSNLTYLLGDVLAEYEINRLDSDGDD